MLFGKGWVYLIRENGDDLLHKIGVTRMDCVEDRIKKLQTGNGNKLVLVKSFLSDKPFKLEKMLHNHFKDNREDGEWFLLSKDDVSGFEETCNKFQDIMDSLKDNPFF